MNDSNEVTRRDFLVSTALITASSAVGHAQPVLGALTGQETTTAASMPTVEVDMGSVFPAGGVYFRKSNVEFLADIHDNLKMEVNGNNIYCRYFFQQYETNGGKAVGHYPNSAISAVENKVGNGRTLPDGLLPRQRLLFAPRQGDADAVRQFPQDG